MSSFRLKQMLFLGTVVGTLGVVLKAQKPVIPVAVPYVSLVTVAKLDPSPSARALRAVARNRRDKIQWSAMTAARREPVLVLKGITLTVPEGRAMREIENRFLDLSQVMNRDDKNSHRAAGDSSTILPSIAALRLEQRAELRAALDRTKRLQFDANVARQVAKETRG